MKYVSTRDQSLRFSAAHAIEQGLSRDGGLFLPSVLPELPALETLVPLTYQQRAVQIMKLFLDEFSDAELTEYAEKAYGPDKFDCAAVAPVVELHCKTHVLELWHGPSALTVTNGETETVHEGVFYRERLQESDKYTVFLDGNHSIVRIDNPERKGSGKLLVIRDSYANSLGCFLAESYETVVLVDLRYYKKAVSELYAQEEFTDILICYCIGNFMTDTNLVWLR